MTAVSLRPAAPGELLKQPKPERLKKRKRMKAMSDKRRAGSATPEAAEEIAYMGDVRCLPCATCGTLFNVKAHHCQDKPPALDPDPYVRQSTSRRKSSGYDTIPLCDPGCHKDSGHGYHDGKRSWREKHGPDYSYIEQTRNRVKEMRESIDF